MQEQEIDSHEASNAFLAFLDAKTKSKNNEHFFPIEKQSIGDELFALASKTYDALSLYKTYRKKFLTVKLSNPHVKDYRAKEQLDNFIAAHDIIPVRTNTGLIFRVMR